MGGGTIVGEGALFEEEGYLLGPFAAFDPFLDTSIPPPPPPHPTTFFELVKLAIEQGSIAVHLGRTGNAMDLDPKSKSRNTSPPPEIVTGELPSATDPTSWGGGGRKNVDQASTPYQAQSLK